MDLVLALDVGGTKLAAGVVDAAGSVRVARRIPTPTGGDAGALFRAVVSLLDEVRRAEGLGGAIVGVGVGCGGPMTRRAVSPLNIPAWRNFPLAARLSEALRLPVAVDNDAKAMALGEGWVGAAAGQANYIGMVVSTGVGGGIVLDGRLLQGEDTNAGHIGHVIVAPDGRLCPCGARGCLEAEASGTAIAAKAGAATAVDVVVAARSGDLAAAAVVAEAGTMVGRAVADVANLLDLRLAVVGGGVTSGAGDLLLAPARAEAARCARIEHARSLRIVEAALGPDAGLVGAAAVYLSDRAS
jgi:glucokinase